MVDVTNCKTLAEAQQDYVIKMRRHFHRHPEPSFKEFETAKVIRAELDSMGIPWIQASETGTVGVIEGNGDCPENILVLRADIDALELAELAESDYRSQVPGMMHGCGHDAHAAMLLGAAQILKDVLLGKFPGKIYLLFQPGEESMSGARRIIESGVLRSAKAMYGQHIWAYYDTGILLTRTGYMMSGARMFHIRFVGTGGHGSSLDKCDNPLTAAAATTLALQTIVSQNVPAKEIASLCVGQIVGGSRANIVPETVTISGNIRAFSSEIDDLICRRICEVAEYHAMAYGVKAKVDFDTKIPPLDADPRLTALLENALRKVVGPENVREMAPDMGSEDFAEYAEICPIAFSFIGCRNKEKGCIAGHHSGYFSIDENAMINGVAAYVQFAADYFNGQG